MCVRKRERENVCEKEREKERPKSFTNQHRIQREGQYRMSDIFLKEDKLQLRTKQKTKLLVTSQLYLYGTQIDVYTNSNTDRQSEEIVKYKIEIEYVHSSRQANRSTNDNS